MGQEIKEQKNWFVHHQTKWGGRGGSVSSKLNEPKILNSTSEMRFSAETLNTFFFFFFLDQNLVFIFYLFIFFNLILFLNFT